MPVSQTSLAAVNAVGVNNVQFAPSAQNLPRKIVIVGTYDPLKTDIVPNSPIVVFSAEDVGDKCGFGFNIHRLAMRAFEGGQGIETWIIPQEEDGTQAARKIAIAASGVIAGTIYLYVAGELVQRLTVASSDTDAQIANKIVAAINAQKELRVTAANTVSVEYGQEVTFTEKSKGLCGNVTDISFNLGYGETTPTGVTFTVLNVSGGSGTPDIQDALDAMGTGDNANGAWFTDFIHGYGAVTAVLNAISTYVGAGNDYVGLWKKTIARPFRSVNGDAVAGSAGLAAVIAFSDARKTDRASGTISAPGSQSHPDEIAAQAMGHAARLNDNRAAQSTIGIEFINIWPGDLADRWTTEFDNRDIAVKAGAGTTMVVNGVLTIQNLISFYHPDSVPQSSNAYRSMRNISILQNVLYNVKLNFAQDKWKGISIVGDLTKVSNVVDRQKARDIDAVIEDLMALVVSFEGHAWIYEAAYTLGKLREAGFVTVREGGIGFTSIIPIILSGEAGIYDAEIQVDTSIAVLTA